MAKEYEISPKSVFLARLTNPEMSDLARQVLVNFIRRDDKPYARRKSMKDLGMISRVPGKERELERSED